VYSWLSSLITKSRKQGTLHLNDLYDLPTYLESTSLTDKLEANWLDEIKRCPQNPSLIRATLRTMGWKIIFIGLLLIPLVSKNNSFLIYINKNYHHFIGIIKYYATIITYIFHEILRTMFDNVFWASLDSCFSCDYNNIMHKTDLSPSNTDFLISFIYIS